MKLIFKKEKKSFDCNNNVYDKNCDYFFQFECTLKF